MTTKCLTAEEIKTCLQSSDPPRAYAAKALGIAETSVTKFQRQWAKTILFGFQYRN